MFHPVVIFLPNASDHVKDLRGVPVLFLRFEGVPVLSLTSFPSSFTQWVVFQVVSSWMAFSLVPGIAVELIQNGVFFFFSRLFRAGANLVGQRPSVVHI
jgi:hypothetical protein